MPLNESPKKPNQMGINQGFQVSCTFLLTFEPHPEVENNLTEAYFSYLSSKLSLFIKKKNLRITSLFFKSEIMWT